MRARLVFLAGFCAAFNLRAAEPTPPAALKVTIADHDKTIALKTGQKMEVVLDANLTTGFSWSMQGLDAALLTQLGEPVYFEYNAKHGMVGHGGTETWAFLAAAPGEQLLKFVYRRPFEPNIPPARSFSFMVRILP